jgi:hypothetical protein
MKTKEGQGKRGLLGFAVPRAGSKIPMGISFGKRRCRHLSQSKTRSRLDLSCAFTGTCCWRLRQGPATDYPPVVAHCRVIIPGSWPGVLCSTDASTLSKLSRPASKSDPREFCTNRYTPCSADLLRATDSWASQFRMASSTASLKSSLLSFRVQATRPGQSLPAVYLTRSPDEQVMQRAHFNPILRFGANG